MISKIKKFYKDQNVLLTGGTGYFGKMIIVKLLRTTDVKNIYLVVRSKQDLEFDKRVTKMFEEEVLNQVNKSMYLEKLHPIEGDLRKKGLGITENDKSFLRDNINIVFHCGASLNMDSKLVDAVMTNVNGTAEILEIMKAAKDLKSFILVSTAYSNCLNKVIEEKFYEPPIDPKLLIMMAEKMKADLIDNISGGIVGKWPNTYSFTKAISENLLLTEGKNMPVALFRPTIVTSTLSEPVPGWSDNLYGPLGILLSSNCGILRVLRSKGGIRHDTVPGDLVINGLLCFAWDVANKWDENLKDYMPPVINFSGNSSPLYIPIKEYAYIAANCGYTPFKKAVWSPMLTMVNNKFTYIVLNFVLHTVPAYIFDSMFVIAGQKPRMRKIYTKLDKITEVLYFFLINEWTIKNENVKALWEKLSPCDRVTYNFDVTAINAESYIRNLMMGLKKYTLKEDMTKAKYHQARYERLLVLHNLLKYLCILLFGYPFVRRLAGLLQNLISPGGISRSIVSKKQIFVRH